MLIAKSKKLKVSRGFTLVELIISVGLFIVVVTISLGAVLSIFSANNRSQNMASIMNNLNYSLDDMTRTIRFASSYHCGSTGTLTVPNSCSGGDVSLSVSSSTDLITYQFVNNTIKKSLNGSTPKSIIGNEIKIQYVKFYVFNTTPGDSRQPYIILVIKGVAGSKASDQSPFDLETLISQRNLDI